MNNQDNNQLGGLTNIQPVGPGGNEVSSLEQVNANNEVVSSVNNDSNSSGITPITPISPVGIQSQAQPGESAAVSSGGTIPISPVPESKDNISNSSSQVTNDANNGLGDAIIPISPENIVPSSDGSSVSNDLAQTMIIPELKLDSSNPFDIGIGQSAGVNNSLLTEDVNNTNNNNSTDNNSTNVTPITPVSVSDESDKVEISVNQNNNVVSSNNGVSNISDNVEVVSVGKYLLHIILFSIPVVGFIMLIVKAVDKKDKNISNLAKAQLLLGVILCVLGVILVALFGATFAGIASMG